MDKRVAFTLAALTFIPVSSVFAECNDNMPYNELVDCIVVEGSGEHYQEWKAKFEKEYSERQQELEQANTQAQNIQIQSSTSSDNMAGTY